jgi:hypothetical protein
MDVIGFHLLLGISVHWNIIIRSPARNKKRTENTIAESNKNGQEGEEDIGIEPNEADADVIMA